MHITINVMSNLQSINYFLVVITVTAIQNLDCIDIISHYCNP